MLPSDAIDEALLDALRVLISESSTNGEDNIAVEFIRKAGAEQVAIARSFLLAHLSDLLPEVRAGAALALGKLKDAAAVKGLVEVLADRDGDVRIQAAYALGCIGPEAAEAVPALATLVRTEDYSDVRATAVGSLGRIGPRTAEAISVLMTALADRDYHMNEIAAEALQQISPKAAELLAALILANEHAFADTLEKDPGLPLAALSQADLCEHCNDLYFAYLIRVICRNRNTDRFSGTDMANALEAYGFHIAPNTVGNRLKKVEKFLEDLFGVECLRLVTSRPKKGMTLLPSHGHVQAAWQLIERVGKRLEGLATWKRNVDR